MCAVLSHQQTRQKLLQQLEREKKDKRKLANQTIQSEIAVKDMIHQVIFLITLTTVINNSDPNNPNSSFVVLVQRAWVHRHGEARERAQRGAKNFCESRGCRAIGGQSYGEKKDQESFLYTEREIGEFCVHVFVCLFFSFLVALLNKELIFLITQIGLILRR